MKFDPSKPVQTITGLKARRADVELNNKNYPLCFIVEKRSGLEEPETYTEQGKYHRDNDFDSELDLINIPEKHVKYINIYPHFGYQSRVSADEFQGGGRTACIRIEYEDGQFDE